MPDNFAAYISRLAGALTPAYTSPTLVPGHDVTHVLRMIGRAPEITNLPGLNQDELVTAIWLHNMDRAPDLGVGLDELEKASWNYLEESPFDNAARQRIAIAAGRHHEKLAQPDDSDVLTALRVLDRIDRMNALGVLSAATNHGRDKPLYVIRDPFRYVLADDGQPYSVYDDIAGRIMEFPLMIEPSMRYLIDVQGMRDLVDYTRTLATHICRMHNLENGVEQDLLKALGPQLYDEYANPLHIWLCDGPS